MSAYGLNAGVQYRKSVESYNAIKIKYTIKRKTTTTTTTTVSKKASKKSRVAATDTQRMKSIK